MQTEERECEGCESRDRRIMELTKSMIKYRLHHGDADMSGLLEAPEVPTGRTSVRLDMSQDSIVSVYPSAPNGPGWANLILWVIYRDGDNKLHEVALQPEDWRSNPILNAMLATYLHFHSMMLTNTMMLLVSGARDDVDTVWTVGGETENDPTQ